MKMLKRWLGSLVGDVPTRPCDRCGTLTDATDLVPWLIAGQPQLICENCAAEITRRRRENETIQKKS